MWFFGYSLLHITVALSTCLSLLVCHDTDGQVHPDKKAKRRIPTTSDYLIVYSTTPGYMSYRDTETGSYYISALVDIFFENSHKKDFEIMDMMRAVSARVADEDTKQQPDLRYMLRKRLCFNPRQLC